MLIELSVEEIELITTVLYGYAQEYCVKDEEEQPYLALAEKLVDGIRYNSTS